MAGFRLRETSVRGTPPFLLWNAGPQQDLVMHVVRRLARRVKGSVGDDAQLMGRRIVIDDAAGAPLIPTLVNGLPDL